MPDVLVAESPPHPRPSSPPGPDRNKIQPDSSSSFFSSSFSSSSPPLPPPPPSCSLSSSSSSSPLTKPKSLLSSSSPSTVFSSLPSASSSSSSDSSSSSSPLVPPAGGPCVALLSDSSPHLTSQFSQPPPSSAVSSSFLLSPCEKNERESKDRSCKGVSSSSVSFSRPTQKEEENRIISSLSPECICPSPSSLAPPPPSSSSSSPVIVTANNTSLFSSSSPPIRRSSSSSSSSSDFASPESSFSWHLPHPAEASSSSFSLNPSQSEISSEAQTRYSSSSSSSSSSSRGGRRRRREVEAQEFKREEAGEEEDEEEETDKDEEAFLDVEELSLVDNIWQYVLGEGERKTSLGYDYLVKLILIGNTCVGKTCLLSRFIRDRYPSRQEQRPTLGVDYETRTLQIDDTKKVKVQAWDTAGHERFRSVTSAYYRSAMGALVVFDLTNRKSFECVREWLEELEEKAPQNIVKVLVGNKADLSAEGKRAVPKEEAEKLAKEYEISYIETSARTGKHVRKAFIELTRQVVECVRELEMQCTYTPTPSPCHMDANRKKRRGDHDQEEKEEKALREGDKDLKDGVYTTSINHALSNGDLDVIQLADTSPVENRHGAYSLFSQAISFLPSSLQHLLLQKRRRRVVSTNRNIYHLFHFNEHPHSNALPFSLDQQESQEGRRRRKSQEDEEEGEEKDDEETTRWKGEEREEEKEGERERRRKTEVERIRDYPYISRGMQFRRYAIDDQLDRCLDV